MNNTIVLKVNANRNIEHDTLVSAKVDTTALWMNEVTLYFNNGDYCDINIKRFYFTGRYISIYENVYAADAFIEMLKSGKISIEQCNVAVI